MDQLFTLDSLVTLGMLVLLQTVLGFDNLLYISLESKRAPADKQAMVRRLGIGLAIGLRIVLLFVVTQLVTYFQEPLFAIPEVLSAIVTGKFNLHAVIVLIGGVFIIYTAIKEVFHMLMLEESGAEEKKQTSVGAVVFWIVLMKRRVLV